MRPVFISIFTVAVLFPIDIRVLIADMPPPYTITGAHVTVLNAAYSNVIADAPSVTFSPNAKGVTVVDKGVFTRVVVTASNASVNGQPFNGTFVLCRDADKLAIINVVPMEDYIAGVLPYEMGPSWPLEALKAQAVAARSYSLHYLLACTGKGNYDVENTTRHQVYRGTRAVTAAVRAAVSATAGEVMLFRNKVVPAYFHASCGGYTEGMYRIFKIDIPYLRGGPCYYCTTNAKRWTLDIPLASFSKLITTGTHTVKSVFITETDASGRAVSLTLVSDGGSFIVPAPLIRKTVGPKKLPSLNFTLAVSNGTAHLKGVGNGHGVGMCQVGAYGMAQHGFTYRTILENYYKLIEIRDVRSVKDISPDIWNLKESYLNAFFSR